MTALAFLRQAADILAMPRRPLPEILAAQQRRVFELVAHACARSPFYRERYRRTEWSRWGLAALPPVTKDELNADLDRVLADPTIGGDQVRDFLAHPELHGRLFGGRYVALRTAGTTGRMGAVLYDREAWNLFKLLSAARGMLGAGTGGLAGIARVLSHRHRVAYMVASGGHFSTAALATLAPPWTRIWAHERVFPITGDEDLLLSQLQEFQPDIIHVYPTFADVLVRGVLERRLSIAPRTISTSSEPLPADTRERLHTAFPRTRISDCYGTTECIVLGRQCWQSDDLHVNADWVVVEPVDAEFRPVGYGQAGHHVLVTNLANRVMPFIRYVLDDVVTPLEPAPCPCGSNLPRIRIQGRIDDTMWLPRTAGQPLALRPLALGSAMTRVPGLRAFQAAQDGPLSIRVRFTTESGAELASVAGGVRTALELLTRDAGLTGPLNVSVEAVEAIARDPVSGKIRRIVSRYQPAPGATGATSVVPRGAPSARELACTRPD